MVEPNMTNLKLVNTLYSIYYIQKDEYIGKKLKSYTGKEVFSKIEHCEKFLIKNGFSKCENIKYDMVMKVGSVTTYSIIKEINLYEY